MKNGGKRSLSNLSTKVLKAYEDSVAAVKLKLQVDFVHGCNKMDAHFEVESARLTVSDKEEWLLRSSDSQSFEEKSSVLYSSRVTKA